jgi:hypothetical protein
MLKAFAETFGQMWPQLAPELFGGLIKQAALSACASTSLTEPDSPGVDLAAALAHISRLEWIRRVIRRALGHVS